MSKTLYVLAFLQLVNTALLGWSILTNVSAPQLIQTGSPNAQMIPQPTLQSASLPLANLDGLKALTEKLEKLAANGAATDTCEDLRSAEIVDVQIKDRGQDSAYVETRAKAEEIINSAIYSGAWTSEKQQELDNLNTKLRAEDVDRLMQTYVENVVAPALARGEPMPSLPYF